MDLSPQVLLQALEYFCLPQKWLHIASASRNSNCWALEVTGKNDGRMFWMNDQLRRWKTMVGCGLCLQPTFLHLLVSAILFSAFLMNLLLNLWSIWTRVRPVLWEHWMVNWWAQVCVYCNFLRGWSSPMPKQAWTSVESENGGNWTRTCVEWYKCVSEGMEVGWDKTWMLKETGQGFQLKRVFLSLLRNKQTSAYVFCMCVWTRCVAGLSERCNKSTVWTRL